MFGFSKKSEPKILTCKTCGGSFNHDDLMKNSMICPSCGKYFRMNARDRAAFTFDSFKEKDKEKPDKKC